MKSVPILEASFISGEDLAAAEYKFVKMSADDTVVKSTAAAVATIGVLAGGTPATGTGVAVNVAMLGTVELMCAAALAVGTRVTPDANGKAVAAGSAEPYFAKLLQASGADGDIVEAFLETGYMPA